MDFTPVVTAGGVVGMFGICVSLLIFLMRYDGVQRSQQGIRITDLEKENRRCERRLNLTILTLNKHGIAVPEEVWN